MNWFDRIARKYRRRLPSSDFWVALLKVRNCLLREEFIRCLELPTHWRDHDRIEWLNIIDCWIDEAICEGWLENDEP